MTSTSTSTMQMDKSVGVFRLLRQTLGMNEAAAGATTWRWEKSDSQLAFMSTFVHAAIESQIDEYRKQSFAKFGLEIAVFPAKHTKTIKIQMFPFGKVEIGHHHYYFSPLHNEEPTKTMRVRFFRGTIQVYFCHSWQPVAAYLDAVGTHQSHEEPQHLQLERQYRWWRSNGKSFNINKLPGELRNAIYDSVFLSEARPFPTSRIRKPGPFIPTFQHSFTALMRTNKQMHLEASSRFYQTTPFLFEHYQILFKTLSNPILRERLQYLRLELTHSGYMDLFYYKHSDGRIAESRMLQNLRELPNLVSLEIHIGPPSRIVEKTWLEGACQKAAVDLIIDGAWASIKGLPVTITGYVKDSQKKNVQARLQAERNKYMFFKECSLAMGESGSLSSYDTFLSKMAAEEQGGVRLDGEAWNDEKKEAEQKFMSTEELTVAMWCKCETRCTLKGWNPVD